MIVILKKTAERQQVELFENWLRSMGLELHKSVGENHTIIGLVGDTSRSPTRTPTGSSTRRIRLSPWPTAHRSAAAASWLWQGPAPWRRRSRSSPWPSR